MNGAVSWRLKAWKKAFLLNGWMDKFGYMVVITVGSYIEGRFDSSTITGYD